ncbi:MAG: ABC transporter permease [Acidobacteria bacterium]|nr:ABC transporter permease [Acidobacteriota bacterium]MCW5968846.1 ABC transporter permease [Blastocatellales bacterium]
MVQDSRSDARMIMREKNMKFLRRQQREEELEAEIRNHLDEAIRDRIERGESPDEARANALREFGNVGLVKEVTREMWGWGWLERLGLDLRFGLRMLRRNPAFALAAILSLAIGIGANTALFSVANAVLWRPLPYPHAERLVRVGEWNSAAALAALKQKQRAFDGLAAWSARDFMLTGHRAPAHLKGQRITPELLPLLGVTPQMGRAFSAEEFQREGAQVVLISDRLWRSRFSADLQLVGQAVTLDQQRYTVVGVLSPRFDFFPEADLLTPLALTAQDIRQENYYNLGIVARLKPGLTLAQARQEMARIAPSLAAERKALIQQQEQQEKGEIAERFDAQRELRLQPLRDLLVKDFRLTLLVLWCVVGFVLLIACANVANLMLARAANRQKELAVRAAIGARRARLVSQLLTESVLMALIGGALGLLCAYLGVKALLAANPAILPRLSHSAGLSTIPRLGEVAISGWVMAFNFGLALLTGVFFGLAPALQFSRPDLHHALKEGAAVSVKGFRLGLRRSTQNLLVIGEVALALVLLIGAGLLIRSLWRLQQIEPGFQPDRLLTLQLEFPAFRYRDEAQVLSFITQLSERLAALPGIESVSAADSLPLSRVGNMGSITIEGKSDLKSTPDDLPLGSAPPPPPMAPPGAPGSGFIGPSAFYSRVSPAYFRTLGMPLRQGREFEPQDRRCSLPVAVINEAMARRYWPGENPLGQRLRADGVEWRTVVGVVGNVRRFALEDQPAPEFYMPILQPSDLTGSSAGACNKPPDQAQVRGKGKVFITETVVMNSTATQGRASYISLMVRTSVQPETVADTVRKTVWELDRDQPILQLSTMQARLDEVFAPRHFNLLLFGVFALVALLLAAVGLYGVLAYSVAQRTHEIGVRLALGAQTCDVLWLIVRQGLGLTLLGVALGLVAAVALTRVLQNLLYGVSATDPATFAGIALLLLGVAFNASFIPAQRATKVDPMIALRHE